MIIDCPYCEAKVDAKVLKEHITSFFAVVVEPTLLLLECPICHNGILAKKYIKDNSEWSNAERLWPDPDKYIDWNLPELVRNSLEEAQRCFRCKAYNACAVMCGRAIESILSEYKTKSSNLAGGLKELLDRQIIDKRIYDWGEALRQHRNIGAHASEEIISKDDAKDLLEFTNAICDYIFLLTKKFENFINRKVK